MRLFLIIHFICILNFSFSQTAIVTFDFAGLSGNESSANSNSSHASVVNPSNITRGTGLIADDNADRFNSRSFSQNSSIDLNDYLQFTITPTTNYTINISQISIQSQRSATGPQSFIIRTSVDNYTSDASNLISITSIATVSSSFNLITAITSTVAVTIRIYGYGASHGNGTWGPGDGTGNDITVSGWGNPLPLQFGAVGAIKTERGVHVKWTAYNENNVGHFEVERCFSNGSTFIKIGSVVSFNRSTISNYYFLDEEKMLGMIYYRIKAVDLDGKIWYSPIVRVLISNIGMGLKIFPNPIRNNEITFYISSLPLGIYNLEVRNSLGQKFYNEKFKIESDNISASVRIQPVFAKGIYLFMLYNNEYSCVKIVVVQ